MNDADWSMIKGNELLSGWSLCITGLSIEPTVMLKLKTRKTCIYDVAVILCVCVCVVGGLKVGLG